MGRGNAQAIAMGLLGSLGLRGRDPSSARPGHDPVRRMWLSLRGDRLIVVTISDESGSLADQMAKVRIGNWNAEDEEWTVPFSMGNFERLLTIGHGFVLIGPGLAAHVEKQRQSRTRAGSTAAETSKDELRRRADKAKRAPRAIPQHGGDAAELICANCSKKRVHVLQLTRRRGGHSYWRCTSCGSDQLIR